MAATARQLEMKAAEALEQIPGVLAAAVWLVDSDTLREVYIAAAPQANITAVQQAATEVLRRHGLQPAAGTVQVGLLDEVASSAPPVQDSAAPPWQGRFLILAGVDIHRSGVHVTCKVRLVRLGESFEAEARELDTENGRARAAALATIAAAEKASNTARLGLEGSQILDLFGRRHVVVSVEASAGRRFSVLSGILAADNTRSIEEAACLATLRAVERWVAW